PVGRDGLVEIVKPVCALVVCRVEAVYRGRSEGTEERLRVRAVKTIQRGPGGGQRLPSPRQHALPFAAADEEVLTADHQRAVKLHARAGAVEQPGGAMRVDSHVNKAACKIPRAGGRQYWRCANRGK